MLVQHERGCLAQMIDAARGLPESPNIIAVEEVPADRVHMYGVVGVGERKGKLFELTQMVEKPGRAKGAVEPHHHRPLHPAAGDLRHARRREARRRRRDPAHRRHDRARQARQPFYGLEFEGRSFDCGSKVGFLAANVAYALERPDIAPAMRAEIKRLLGDG